MAKKSIIKIIKIPKVEDDAFLYFAQYPDQIPFDIKRVYFITNPVKGLPRGKHAHKTTRQILFCICGRVRMVLDDGYNKEEVVLSESEDGIMLEPLIWHEMLDMDENTILLVFASEKYDPIDYIREYSEFKKVVG